MSEATRFSRHLTRVAERQAVVEGISPGMLGLKIVGDHHFVANLRQGVGTLRRVDALLEYVRAYTRQDTAAKDSQVASAE